LLSLEKVEVGNFVILDNIENKIIKVIPLQKDTKVIAVKGKHVGKQGKIKEIVKEGSDFVARMTCKEGEINVNIKNLFAIE